MTPSLLIATRNAHKTQEIAAILPSGFRFLTLNDFPDAPNVIEDGNTFVANARKKAIGLAEWLVKNPALLASKQLAGESSFYVLADDSGLEVDALNGAPGIFSARFAALDTGSPENSPDAANNAKLLRLLENIPNDKRTARFRCVLALTPISPTGEIDFLNSTQVFEGKCEGRIKLTASGQGGFGYDPLFVPDGCEKSYAELGAEIKNQISHRARALQQLRAYFTNTQSQD